MSLTAARYDVAAIRAHFPSLSRELDGRPIAYLDGPAGTQVPLECIDAIAAYLRTSNANLHGHFATSAETESMLQDVHAAGADFVGATSGEEIAFGANMTTLTFAVSRAIGRTLSPGDEIVVTRLDHDGNVAPWLALEERGAVIRWVEIQPDDCTLDLDGLAAVLGPRTRVVAIGMASNAVGTINPVRRIADMVHTTGARLWVDAVHAAPHLPIDVVSLDADYLVCSPYKFYGPHLGMLWGRRGLLETLPAYKVRPAPDELPGRWETGTQSHEALAGLLGTFRYLEWLGVAQGRATGGQEAADHGRASRMGRAGRLRAALGAIRDYERNMTLALLEGLASISGLAVHGITEPERVDERCPTVGFTMAGHAPAEIAAFLGARGIATWDGDYYAHELIRAIGLAETGGMLRVGLVHYNTVAEIDRLVEALQELAG